MEKTIVFTSYDGTIIEDSTPEAENRYTAMEYIEERQKRRTQREEERKRELLKNPLYKLACICGII